MQAQTVTIVGMGRVGVSIARALRASEAGLTIVGHERIRQLAEEAKGELGAIARVERTLATAGSGGGNPVP